MTRPLLALLLICASAIAAVVIGAQTGAGWGDLLKGVITVSAAVAWVLVLGAGVAVALRILPDVGTAIVQGVRHWAQWQHWRMAQLRADVRRAEQAQPDRAGETDPNAALALALLDDSARVGDGETVPRWETLAESPKSVYHWSSQSWQAAVAALRGALIVRQGGGGGTVVHPDYGDVAVLARELRAGKVALSTPLPHFDGAEGG